MSKQILALRRMGSDLTLDLTYDEFKSIAIAQHALSNALALEQKYAILTENYLALKNICSEQCRRWATSNPQTYMHGNEMHIAINTAVLNYLSSGRMYIDQTLQDIEKCEYETQNASASISDLRSKLYDKHREYAFVEAFRNHCQHYSIPKLKLKFNAKYVDNSIHNTLTITIKKAPLYNNKDLSKKRVDPMPDVINLVESIDIHYSCLQATHYETRNLIEPTLSSAENVIKSTHDRFAEVHDCTTQGLRIRIKKDNEVSRSLPLSMEWNDVRKNLCLKYEAYSSEKINVIAYS